MSELTPKPQKAGDGWPNEIIRRGSAALTEADEDYGSFDEIVVAILDAAVGAGLLEHLLQAQGWEKRSEGGAKWWTSAEVDRVISDLSGRVPQLESCRMERDVWVSPWRSVVESTDEAAT